MLDNLARRYWKPVYHYLRARGYQDADARDLCQGFFVEVVLGRDLFGHADRGRGRFRAYLLHCLKNYARQSQRRQIARRRSPDRPVLSIDQMAEAEDARFEPAASEPTPEDAFHRKWATSLLEQVLERLARGCSESGLDVHFRIFHGRFIKPAIEGVPPVSIEHLARQLGLTPKQVANHGETVRRRFRKLLLDEVRLTVDDEEAAREELQSLMTHLTRAPD
ncbi:MAG: sigma-70 family RNA polymerase sigma factor [Phycisphaerae bacterium]|nr:sigma-70 family RNA polymerase sigma factor [Phycisphaerae bacterium]